MSGTIAYPVLCIFLFLSSSMIISCEDLSLWETAQSAGVNNGEEEIGDGSTGEAAAGEVNTDQAGSTPGVQSPDAETKPDVSSLLALPEGYPFWEGSHIEIDRATLESFAEKYCMLYGSGANALDFICGWLPLEIADSLCLTSPDKAQMNKYLGAMYISGYFGGVWLRDMLFSNSAEGSSGGIVQSVISAMMKMMPDVLSKVMESGGDKIIFKNLALLLGTTAYTAINGGRSAVFSACRANAAPFFTVYGYDYGYYYYLVNNPPEGTIPGADPLGCDSFMDCSMQSHELETLNQYKSVLEDLLHPAPLYRCFTAECRRWMEMYEVKNIFGLGSVSLGNMVWENVMSDNVMMEGAYSPLVDLSARFMLVSELTLLPTVKGYAEYDEDAARCGLLQQAGMMAWLGSYVLGLSSSLPEGTFPELTCQ